MDGAPFLQNEDLKRSDMSLEGRSGWAGKFPADMPGRGGESRGSATCFVFVNTSVNVGACTRTNGFIMISLDVRWRRCPADRHGAVESVSVDQDGRNKRGKRREINHGMTGAITRGRDAATYGTYRHGFG